MNWKDRIEITDDTFYVEKWSDGEVDLCLSEYTTKEQAEALNAQILQNEKIVERLKLKIGQYHGKTNYEDYDKLLQSILGESE